MPSPGRQSASRCRVPSQLRERHPLTSRAGVWDGAAATATRASWGRQPMASRPESHARATNLRRGPRNGKPFDSRTEAMACPTSLAPHRAGALGSLGARARGASTSSSMRAWSPRRSWIPAAGSLRAFAARSRGSRARGRCWSSERIGRRRGTRSLEGSAAAWVRRR